ncbi:MAG TPA: tetratricopeptide repeat protein [Salinivirga sp.]|uniref:tetratricopeptide repeat protein n=1 Tax=Salinivirga sp. TaxID=1970192 RepID=UPI002B45AF39|nr:tetratricopeptide repeat protein [Salinivirga sp.]HKK60371.1 tetratricopeptide repeat protein [Salinivirga sp.]
MKTSFKYLTIVMAAIMLFTGCKELEKMQKMADQVTLNVQKSPVEMHGDSIAIKLTGSFPPKFFQKKAQLEVIPVLKYNGQEVAFKSIKLQGEDVEANNKVIPFESGGSFEIVDKIAYDPAMREATLIARGTATVKDESMVVLEREVAPGVMSTATLLDFSDAKVVRAADNFQRVTYDAKEAKIQFLINRYNIRGRELRKDEIKAFNDYIKQVAEKENMNIENITIDAYASPDGTVELNTELSEDRKNVTEKYLGNTVKKADIEIEEEKNVYNTRSVAEDWEGFKKELQKSDVPDKDLILRVLSMYNDPEVREKEIRNISAAFEELKDEVLPQLRRSEFRMKVAVVGFSDEEISKFAMEKPDTLNVEELLYAATLTEDLAEQKQIFTTVTEQYSDDWRGHNNLGVVNYLNGNYADALTSFEAAKAIEANNSKVLNNLGAVALAQGDVEKASEYLKAATAGGNETSYNQALIATKKGEYEDAVDMYASSKYQTVNFALAKLLQYSRTQNEQAYDAALGILEKVENKENPLLYYVKAVVGARKQDSDMLFNNLRTAIEKNADLKQTAATDVEFRRYKEDATFTSIVE